MTWPLWLGLLLAFLALAAAGVFAYGSKRWSDATRILRRSLEAARTDGKARSASQAHFDSRELEDLPAPVQRYFRAVLKEGQPIVSALTIEMVGTFNMSTTAEQWKPFTSRGSRERRNRCPANCNLLACWRLRQRGSALGKAGTRARRATCFAKSCTFTLRM